MISEQIKNYIENNIALIDQENYEEFFECAPEGIGGILYESNIEFLNKINYIPRGAFENSKDLTHITIPGNIEHVAGYSFANCVNLTNVVINDGVTEIGTSAFFNCEDLINVIIPPSVKYMGDTVFYACHSLTSITFQGTKSEWQLIMNHPATEDTWSAFSELKTVKCIEGDIQLR